jgi:hypothetical protein
MICFVTSWTVRRSITAREDTFQIYCRLQFNNRNLSTFTIFWDCFTQNMVNGRIDFQSSHVIKPLVRVVKAEVYNKYYNKPDLLAHIFNLFLTEPGRSYLMRIRADLSSYATSYSGRKRVKRIHLGDHRRNNFPGTDQSFLMMLNKQSWISSEWTFWLKEDPLIVPDFNHSSLYSYIISPCRVFCQRGFSISTALALIWVISWIEWTWLAQDVYTKTADD